MVAFNEYRDIEEQQITPSKRVTLPMPNEQAKIGMLVSYPNPPRQLMNTIAETARLCQERDIGLNDSTLRYLCKNGTLPCVKVGKKTLINWNVLINQIFSGEPTVDKTEQSETELGIIRPVPVRLKK